MKTKTISLLMMFMATIAMHAQDPGWNPTGVWPFINKRFHVATVVTGVIKLKKTEVPCNIHIGNQTLWYAQNDTLMEAIPGTVVRVDFPDGVYIPVNNRLWGKIIREDSLANGVGKVIKVVEVDQVELDRNAMNVLNTSASLMNSQFAAFSSLGAQISDVTGGETLEEKPIPLAVSFYYVYNGELFEATEKNILKRINPKRKSEYRWYTRNAEVISSSEKSMLKVWEDFFINYNTPITKK